MDEETLKKIKVLKERTNLSEEEAEELLNKCNGDVIEAIIYFEREKQKTRSDKNDHTEKISDNEFINYIKELIKSGNVARIIIRKDDTVLVNIPVNAGIVVGIVMILQPVLLILGAATAVFTNLEIDIIRKDGSVEVVNKLVKSSVESSAKVASEVGHEIKEKVTYGCEKLKGKINDFKRKL